MFIHATAESPWPSTVHSGGKASSVFSLGSSSESPASVRSCRRTRGSGGHGDRVDVLHQCSLDALAGTPAQQQRQVGRHEAAQELGVGFQVQPQGQPVPGKAGLAQRLEARPQVPALAAPALRTQHHHQLGAGSVHMPSEHARISPGVDERPGRRGACIVPHADPMPHWAAWARCRHNGARTSNNCGVRTATHRNSATWCRCNCVACGCISTCVALAALSGRPAK